MIARDDLGFPCVIRGRARRVVSLVPSLTESIACTDPGILVGATDWCAFPDDLDLPRVRGTKNPDCSAIVALRPDIVVANMEENRQIDVERLRNAGLTVWVTRVETVDAGIESVGRMLCTALGLQRPAWLDEVAEEWARPPELSHRSVAIAIWRDPWMAVGRSTFTGDLVARLGLSNAFGSSPDRYPHVSIGEIEASGASLVILPDEPYPFGADDGPEAFAAVPTVLVSGRLLTWYGPSLLAARRELSVSLHR